jgi:hypothetical protein
MVNVALKELRSFDVFDHSTNNRPSLQYRALNVVSGETFRAHR